MQSQTAKANAISDYLDHDELEAIAMCFDNIRKMRSEARMPKNDDTLLGDQFDQELTSFINQLTATI